MAPGMGRGAVNPATSTTATEHIATVEIDDDTSRLCRYRWTCSCTARGTWKHRMGQARQGAALHARRVRR